MRQKIIRFMQGRYGIDQMSRFTIGLSLFFMVLSYVFPIKILYLVALLLMFYTYFRILSKNHSKRYKENQVFLRYYNPVLFSIRRKKSLLTQRKTHHIYTCPSCKQKIRIPRGKGKIQIRCPKCSTEFIKKS